MNRGVASLFPGLYPADDRSIATRKHELGHSGGGHTLEGC
jgi:hypothetical protein